MDLSLEQLEQSNPRTVEVYRCIVRFKRDNDGLFPTIREIGKLMEISTTSGVDYHLRKLVDLGLLKRRVAEGNRRAMPYIVVNGRWTLEGGNDA
jgi:DNA-binding MarR family transcriptional regulator